MSKTVFVSLCAAALVSSSAFAQTTIRYGENLPMAVACASTNTLTFFADADDVIILHLAECQDFGGVCQGWACCCFDQRITLLDPSGIPISNVNTPLQGNNCYWRTRLTTGEIQLTSSGTYTVLVADANDEGRGSVAVFLQRTNGPANTDLLQSGEEVLGRIVSCGVVHTYVFDAQAHHPVTLTMEPAEQSEVAPVLEVYNPQGRSVALPGNGTATFTPTVNGVFTVLAMSAFNQTGTYRLSLTLSPTPVEASTWGTIKAHYR